MELIDLMRRLDLVGRDRTGVVNDDQRRLFRDQANQVKIEEQYERVEKKKYNQKGIKVEVHIPLKKLKIYLIYLKRQLPTLKKGEPIKLTYDADYIIAGFDELKRDHIILSVGAKGWEIYSKLLRILGESRMLFDFELSHNQSIYVNKISACNEVENDPYWLAALLPNTIRELEERKEDDALPDLLENIDHLTKDNIVCSNNILTDCQKTAIINIMKAKNRPQPYLLFGPPGTGKTVTLAELVYQIFTRSETSRVLVCGNSNYCVDLLARRIVDYGIFKEGEIVRLMATGRMDVDDAIPRGVREITMEDGSFKLLEKPPRIVLATCQKSSYLKKIGHFNYEFDYVIVDEVGHCQEPETLIPVTLRKSGMGSIVFGGDPHQLQPVAKSQETPLLKESILQRLFKSEVYQKRFLNGPKFSGTPKYDERYITKLVDCHRSDKRVMVVNNERFYNNDLKFTYETPEILLDIFKTKNPLLFAPTIGVEGKLSTDDTSHMNKEEARRCINFVRLVYNGGFKPDDVGIIAAYRSQVTYISSLFEDYKIERCKVASIDEFQGEEKQIIIISTVRSATGKRRITSGSLGFLKEYQRFNVAVSRARAIVIVVGDPRLLAADDNWAAYMKKATEISLEIKFE